MIGDTEQGCAAGAFHLMRGGPIFRLMVKLRLEGLESAYVVRRSLALVAVTWVPILLLSALEGLAWPGRVRIPFLIDFPAHVLFLVSLPLLIIAEIVVEPGITRALSLFTDRGLIREEDRQAFESLVLWARGRCESRWSELVISLLALFPLVFLRGEHWNQNILDSWVLAPGGTGLSLAGVWSVFVAGFFCRVLLYRWVWRLFIWTRLLRRIARLDLNTVATHPDRAGGLGFLAEVEMRFSILAFAIGSVVSANVAGNILFQHTTLASEKVIIIAYIAGATIVIILPLLALAGVMHRTWRRGLHDYGGLASDYVHRFDRKWIQRNNPEHEELLGTSDIQSLADLSNSFQIVHEIKLLPINRRCIIALLVSAALPMLPLVFLDPWAMEIAKKLLERLL